MRKIAAGILVFTLSAALSITPSFAKQLVSEGKCPNGKNYAVWYDSSWGGDAYGAGTYSFGPSYFGSTPEEAVRKFCR